MTDYYDLVRRIAIIFDIQIHSIQALVDVNFVPPDLQPGDPHVFIVQEVQDGSFHVHVLRDIEYHQSEFGPPSPTRARFVKLLPFHACRSQVLRELDLSPYCQQLSSRCLVWLNGVPWHLQDGALKDLSPGDFLRVLGCS